MAALTFFHVLLSLIGIAAGLPVLFGLLTGQRYDRWTRWFLFNTVATSVTGFFFPFHGFTPAHGVGILSLLVLAAAIVARYRLNLAGAARKVYAITAVIALYLNVFVLVVQLFQKVPALNSAAPAQTEPPFVISQGLVLAVFLGFGIAAAIRFREEPAPAAARAAKA